MKGSVEVSDDDGGERWELLKFVDGSVEQGVSARGGKIAVGSVCPTVGVDHVAGASPLSVA